MDVVLGSELKKLVTDAWKSYSVFELPLSMVSQSNVYVNAPGRYLVFLPEYASAC